MLVMLVMACPASAGTGWNGFGGTTLPDGSWRPYADTSPFNQLASAAAVHPDSPTYVQNVLALGPVGNLVAGTAGQGNDWGHPTFYAQPTDPLYTLHGTGTPDAVEGMQIRIPAKARPSGSSDADMTVVEPDGWEYDFWQVQSRPAGGGTLTYTSGGRTRIDGDGLGSGGTPAHFGNLAGMIRGPELAAGHINHALYVVLKCAGQGTGFGYGTTATGGASFVYPAHAAAPACSSATALPPVGARLRLDMTDSQIAALLVPAWKKTILTALAHYGGYVGGTGGPGLGFMFESGTTYTALGLADPLATFAQRAALPTWNGDYVFDMASGVDWARYLRILVPPSSTPVPAASGWEGFGGKSLPGAGWRPYASDSPFNTLVGSAPVHPSSAAIVAKTLSLGSIGNLLAGTAGQSNDWSHPTFYAQPSDPLFTLKTTGTPNSINGMQIHIPDDARPASGGDAHMTVVEPDGWEYDFWQVQSKPAGGGTMTFTAGGRTRIDGDGLRSGATAAMYGSLAGMIRGPELAAGHIDHALFIVVKCVAKSIAFGYGARTSATSSYVYPAVHGGSTCSSDDPSLPPMGARFQLAMSDSQIAALAVPAWKKTILTALAHYGGYVGDTGGSGFNFMFESGTTYTALGLADPLVGFAQRNGVPSWNGDYVFDVASGVDWARYLRVLVPPSP